MKKFLALMLALALLAVSAVGLAEDAAEAADAVESSSYAAVSFQDPVLTVTENGEETSYDLTGLSLSFEGMLNDAASWLVATLSGPDGADGRGRSADGCAGRREQGADGEREGTVRSVHERTARG